MDAARIKPLVFGLAGLLLVTAVGSMLSGVKKKHDLESSALASAADATARLQEVAAGKADAARLQAHADAVAQNLEKLRREDLSRSKPLAEAAELYLTDAQAILRNHAAAARARAASVASHRALTSHLAHAAGRGTAWIQQAVALKTRAERDNFDYRTAVEALAGLYHTHRESQVKLRAVAPGVPLLEEAQRQSLRQQALDAEKQAAAQIERIRTMALPR